MAKKKEEAEPVVEQPKDEDVAMVIDPVAVKANQIMQHMTSDMMYEGVQLDLNNPDHCIVAAWLVGRGGWLRK